MELSHYLKPYQRHVFIRIFVTFIVIVVVANIGTYYFGTDHLLQTTRNNLMQIASKVANDIPVDLHESLISPEQQKSDDYKLLELYFRSVMDGNPKIDDVYTLRPTTNPQEMTFVVSGMETKDKNGNNLIEEFEQKPNLGEVYKTSCCPEMLKALSGPTADQSVTYDKWGAWISGYAPLRNNKGKTVAIVGIDMSSTFISDQRTEVLQSILYVDIILLPILILIAYLLSRRLGKPFRILVQGMKQVSHGDLSHKLNLKAKGEDLAFVQLFNSMLDMFGSLRKHELSKKPSEEDEEE